MHVAANITSGLLPTDSSAVELVPLLQAEVRKLREMLAAQQLMQQVQQVGKSAKKIICLTSEHAYSILCITHGDQMCRRQQSSWK
jgi:hypothetical protein